MLTGAFLVGVTFAIFEVTLVRNIPALKRWIEKSPILELVFSIALGVFVGRIMGIPAGVTITIGNLFGTFITKTIYSLKLIDRWEIARVKAQAAKVSAKATVTEFQEIIHTIWLVVTAPFRLCTWILRKLNSGAAVLNRHLPARKAA